VNVEQGHIWSVSLDPRYANEQSGVRPCLVVSTDRFNSLPIDHAIIVPLTSRNRQLPHHLMVLDDGRLDRPSWAMCEAVRTVSTQRFGRLISSAHPETTRAVIRQIVMWLAVTA